MINWNLRLPIIEPGIICPCGQEIDIHGNHFFQCKKYSKMQLSNSIHDCIHFVIAETGQHAGLISSKRDVLTEPVNLAQHNPTSRPADTLINLTPTYANPPIIPFLQLAIDVTITPPLPITDGDDPSTYAASAINHHQQYERKKFGGRSINTDNSYVLGEQVISALNNSSTILLPFTVDPHGGIGPLASRFLPVWYYP
jgi:hypothetical protein